MICPNCHQNRINLEQCEHCQSREQTSALDDNSLDIDPFEHSMLDHPPINTSKPIQTATAVVDPFDEDHEQTGIKNEILEGQLALENKYILGKEIGRGGMGFVYQALDLTLKRVVAIKILPPKYNQDQQIISRFLKEARAMAMLDHPNIVPVYSIGHAEDLHYFVMKFLEGKTISKIIQRQNKNKQPHYTLPEMLSIIYQICDGLEHAHAKNILHRDIKPSNLMVGDQLKTTIMDFGIVKMVEKNNVKTQHGKIFGTPEYMSPEQAMGKGDYFAASDIYSLAVVFYEMICGELPFQAEGPIEMIIQHIRQPFPGFKGKGKNLYPKLEKVISKAMAKDPMQRYQTVTEFKKALFEAQESQPNINAMAMGFNTPIITPTIPAFVTPPPFALTPTPPTISTTAYQVESQIEIPKPTQAISLENSPIPMMANSLELNDIQPLVSPSYSPLPTRPNTSVQVPYSPILKPSFTTPLNQVAITSNQNNKPEPPPIDPPQTNRAGHYKTLPIKRATPQNK
jgi:serine/threonine protein kinase